MNVIKNDGGKIDQIIYLRVPKDELLKRAVKRAEQENRTDDRDSNIVLTRIDEFENSTIPAVNYIKESGIKTIEIEGNQSIEEIYETLKRELK